MAAADTSAWAFSPIRQTKTFALSALIALTTTSTLAQTSVDGEYYVVRDPATRKCRVVDERPAVAADMVGIGPVSRVGPMPRKA